MSWIAPTSDVLTKDSENLIVSSKLTMPVPKFATKPVVLSPGVIVPRSNVEAAAGRPASPTINKLANSNATSRFMCPILCLIRGHCRLKSGHAHQHYLLVLLLTRKEGKKMAAAEAFL